MILWLLMVLSTQTIKQQYSVIIDRLLKRKPFPFGVITMIYENLLIEPPETPQEIRAIRSDLGLTARQCAAMVQLNDDKFWLKYERDNEDPSKNRRPSKQTWTLFLLATGTHPFFKLENK